MGDRLGEVPKTEDETGSCMRQQVMVLIFFACFFLLLSGGRLASGDASNQMQAAMLLVTTGHLGTSAPPGGPEGGWVRAQDGRYYEPHDVGNIVLMLPAAALGALLSGPPAQRLYEDPPIIAIVGASLTCALLSGIGCFMMFRLFRLRYRGRTAFLLSLAFPTTTFLWAYTKTAWDVTGACIFMCAVLYFSARLLMGSRSGRDAVLAGVTLAGACAFRFSLVPFFVPVLAYVLYLSRSHRRWWHYPAAALGFLVTILPSLGYNFVRMGSVLRPATTSALYLQGNNAMDGDIARGVFGLLLGPNRGLFLYSPIFLLLFALLFMLRKTAAWERRLFSTFAIGSIFYLFLIAKMRNWGAFGWGPRYLIPMVPIWFLGVSMVLPVLWEKHRKIVVAFVVVSGLLSLAPVLVNWNLATTEFAHAVEQNARLPYQQKAVWTGLLMGLEGKKLPLPPEVASDPIRSAGARFPDLWTVRLAERTHPALGIGISLLLLIPALWCLLHLVREAEWKGGDRESLLQAGVGRNTEPNSESG
jgi:hypothetical protein